MLFFAFTGWEVGAGIAAEFRDPERDFPRAMLLSFAVACALYLAVAYVRLHTDLHGRYATPFVEIVKPMFGETGARAVALIAALIVFANLAGAVWGVSRLVYGLARDGGLPSRLSATRDGRPLAAVAVTLLTLTAVLMAARAGLVGLPGMLALAGQNFLILYGVAAAALAAMGQDWRDRMLAFLVVAIVVALLMIQGAHLAYPVGLVAAAGATELLRSRRSKRPLSDSASAC